MPHKLNDYFFVDEFLPPECIDEKKINEFLKKSSDFKVSDYIAQYIAPNVISTMLDIRTKTGLPIIINNWENGGQFKYRGYRPASCTEGAPNSAHKQGLGIDFHFGFIDYSNSEKKPDLYTPESTLGLWPIYTKSHSVEDKCTVFKDWLIAGGRDKYFPEITEIEANTTGWIHLGFRQTGKKELMIFNG
jgi:hypothetical protein